MAEPDRFIFAICQTAATSAARRELLAGGGLKLAYSQPGFITFKVENGSSFPERFNLTSTLARSYGWALGKVQGDQAGELMQQVIENPELAKCQHLHVVEREKFSPGEKGFEPGISVLANEIASLAKEKIKTIPEFADLKVNQVAKPDERVFDVILVQPNEWWMGYHNATNRSQRWVGGVPRIDTTREVVSRAYFKLEEALLWSGFRIRPDEVCAEIGSAPGGACQLLLEKGNRVLAIDPAEMDETIAGHENLVHIKKRGRDVRKKEFKDVRWLLVDLINAPTYTLDTIEEIVANENTNVRGLLLTLKLTDWQLVETIPALMERVRKMGFGLVKARQLAFNRKEFCLAALRDRFELRQRIRG